MIIQQPKVKQDQELESKAFLVQPECIERVCRADDEPLQGLTSDHGGFSIDGIYRWSGFFSDIKNRGSKGLEMCFNVQFSFSLHLMLLLLEITDNTII